MKKYFYLAAVSAMMLTACSSDKDVLEPKTGPAVQEITQQAVGFDVYVPEATGGTRAGYEGVMNTTRLQGDANGFGVYAYYTDQTDGTAQAYPHTTGSGTTNDYIPNFMYNEQITWNNTNKGWTYSPLKYWPNETGNDSQSNPTSAVMDGTNTLIDQLTFFAYAPYVSAGSGDYGIRAITANTGVLTTVGTGSGARAKGDPAIEYKTASSSTKSVDLLWGVAPAGGLHYTAVNGTTDGAAEGMPYIDLVKPDVNTSLKFNFQHALARFGFTVAAAIDQVPQGGNWPGDDKTRITVEKVELSGYFSNEGVLNLNNTHKDVANWINFAGTDLAQASALGTAPLNKKTVTISTDIDANIKDQGAQVQTIDGVNTSKRDLIQARYYQVDDPTTFVAGDKYYTSAGVELYADITGDFYTTNTNGDYLKVTNSKDYPTTYYTLTATAVADKSTPSAEDTYTKSGNDYIYAYAAGADISSEAAALYTLGTPVDATASVTTASFTWPNVDYYKPERSYLMVIPTNNVQYICTDNFGAGHADNNEALKTVWVKITYYVTTEDTKLSDGYSRVQNVIEKKVVLPSLENGKSYNLHLLLGLTSVKIEAEVSDWKEIYVQTDLPQNTPGD